MWPTPRRLRRGRNRSVAFGLANPCRLGWRRARRTSAERPGTGSDAKRSASGKAVGDAYRRYRRLQHEIRLNDAERARVPPATVAVEAGAVKALWQHLFG